MNILIVGLGSIAKKHLTALKQLNVISKIYALRSGSSSEVLDGIISIKSLDELTELIEFAIISNPTARHAAAIRLLSQRSIPLFIEKPAVHTLSDMEECLDIVTEKGIFNYVACNLRFNPCIQFLRSAIKEGTSKINEVNIYAGSFLPEWRSGRNYHEIYSSSEEMGGGVHLDLFHELDYAVWLFGVPEEVKAVRRSESTLDINSKDYANYCLIYPDFCVSIILNYYRRKAKRTLEVVFDDRTWMADLINNIIYDDAETVVFEAGFSTIFDTYHDQMKYFIEHLNGKTKPMNDLAESAEILKICLHE